MVQVCSNHNIFAFIYLICFNANSRLLTSLKERPMSNGGRGFFTISQVQKQDKIKISNERKIEKAKRKAAYLKVSYEQQSHLLDKLLGHELPQKQLDQENLKTELIFNNPDILGEQANSFEE